MWHVWGKYYVDGNVNSMYPQVTADNWTYGVYNQIDASGNDGTYTPTTKDTIRIETPIVFVNTTTHTAEQAFEKVLAYAGASLHRDAVDEVMVSDARDGKTTYTGSGNPKGIINSQDDLKPAGAGSDWSAWPELKQTEVPLDTDRDGMPDEWETAHGLNPNDASDGKTVADNGYTNVENYINAIVEPITTAQNEGGFVLTDQQDFDSFRAGINVPKQTGCSPAQTTIYTLDGRRCTKPVQKGIYIVNGKKIIL
jgi:hypothetical protein